MSLSMYTHIFSGLLFFLFLSYSLSWIIYLSIYLSIYLCVCILRLKVEVPIVVPSMGKIDLRIIRIYDKKQQKNKSIKV